MLVRAVLSGVVLRQVRGRGWSEPERACAPGRCPTCAKASPAARRLLAVVSADVQQVPACRRSATTPPACTGKPTMSPTRAGAHCSKGSAGSSPTSARPAWAPRLARPERHRRRPDRMAAYLRIEAMANEVLGAFGYPWACLYDTRAHSPPNAARRPPDPPRRRYDRCWRPGAVSDTAPRAAAGVSSRYRRAPVGPGALGGSVVDMGFADTFTTRVQKLPGRMKRNAGAVSGDRRLEAEGRSRRSGAASSRPGRKFRPPSAAAVVPSPGPTRSACPDPAARLHPPDSDRDQRVEPGALRPADGRRSALPMGRRDLPNDR